MSTTPVVAPDRSLEQRMAALLHANEVRVYRAHEIKPRLRSGELALVDVFRDEMCASMKVIDALLPMPKVGRVKANKVLRESRVSPSKTIGGLTERQRGELLGLVALFPSARVRVAA